MERFALIELKHQKIAFPHHHIYAIERCSQSQNRVRISGKEWRVMELDSHLTMRPLASDESEFAVCFKAQPIALRCAKVENIDQVMVTPIPLVMRKPDSAIEGFILHQGQMVFLLNIDRLLSKTAGVSQCNATHGV